MSDPRLVLISDIHYNLTTLPVADAALRLAIQKANELNVPLCIAGDLHDTKAILRAECVTAIINTLLKAKTDVIVLVGNHDRINEKAKEHALEFLKPYVFRVIDYDDHYFGIDFFAYSHDREHLMYRLMDTYSETPLIMHQGVEGSNMGDYIQDKSSITKESLLGRRVISGHYHARQTIELPGGGRFDYIGNPYTLGWGEANDPPKGFQILMEDGSLEFVPTNLRKHVVLNVYTRDLCVMDYHSILPNDLVWMKVHGPKEELALLTKEFLKANAGIEQDFRLDLIPDQAEVHIQDIQTNRFNPDILDEIIDSLENVTPDQKKRLKSLWKSYASR